MTTTSSEQQTPTSAGRLGHVSSRLDASRRSSRDASNFVPDRARLRLAETSEVDPRFTFCEFARSTGATLVARNEQTKSLASEASRTQQQEGSLDPARVRVSGDPFPGTSSSSRLDTLQTQRAQTPESLPGALGHDNAPGVGRCAENASTSLSEDVSPTFPCLRTALPKFTRNPPASGPKGGGTFAAPVTSLLVAQRKRFGRACRRD